MISFKKLFHPKPEPSDDLTQPQREAIVDLLNYLSFTDHTITLGETDLIDSLGAELHWEIGNNFDYYENKSVGLVRGVVDNPGAVGTFLQGVRSRLDSEKSREIALDLADKLVKAGKSTPEESQAFAAVAQSLG